MKIFTTSDREQQSNLDHVWHYIRAERGACDTGGKNGIGTEVGKKEGEGERGTVEKRMDSQGETSPQIRPEKRRCSMKSRRKGELVNSRS